MSSTPAPAQAKAFALAFFAYYGYVGLLAPYASLYFSAQNMSGAQIGILMSLMQVMRIFGPNLWGWVADSSGQRVQVVRYTAVAAWFCLAGFLVADQYRHFFWLMVLLNFFTSSQVPLLEAIMLSEMRGDLSHYGRLRLWGSVGFMAAVMGGGYLLDLYGVVIFPGLTLGLLALTCFMGFCIKDPPKTATAQQTQSSFSILRRPEVGMFFLSAFLMVAAHSALYVYYSLYLEQLGYSKVVIGAMWALGVLVEILFFYFQAPLFRRFGVRRLMLASLALGILRFWMIGSGAQFFLILLIAQLLHAATFAAHHSAAVMALQRWFGGPLQASGQAWYTSICYGLGGSLGGLIFSLCWEHVSPESVYWMAAGMSALAMFAAWLSYRWQARSIPGLA
jgi:MFS transporter, PPP family, 3-phenylpropionic acid transporter